MKKERERMKKKGNTISFFKMKERWKGKQKKRKEKKKVYLVKTWILMVCNTLVIKNSIFSNYGIAFS